jgi:hypothetical protein
MKDTLPISVACYLLSYSNLILTKLNLFQAVKYTMMP